MKLPLGELEAPACPAPAVFFTFNHAGVAGKVAVAPQAEVVSLIHLAQGAGKAVAAGACLSVDSPAVYIDQNIKLILVCRNH